MQTSLPYTRVYGNGVIETDENVYTKAYKMVDMNFKTATDAEQLEIFTNFGSFLNNFPPNVRFQMLIRNRHADKHTAINAVRFYPSNDALNYLRSEMNTVLLDRVAESKNNLAQDKYLVVSVEDDDIRHAMQTLQTIETDVVGKGLQKVVHAKGAIPLSTEERLHMLFDIYNQNSGTVFGNAVTDEGEVYFDLSQLSRQDMTTKDIVAPNGLEFRDKYFMVGDTYGCAMYLKSVPTWLKTEFLTEIANLPLSLIVSVNYEPMDTNKAILLVKNQLLGINAQIAGVAKAAARDSVPLETMSPDLARGKQQVGALMEDLVGRDQKMFYLTVTVTLFAETRELLLDGQALIKMAATKHLCPIETLTYQQEDGFNASLPLAVNRLKARRMYTTESAAVFLPYTSQELFQKNGIFYGLNETTNNMIVYSRTSGQNYNGLFFGMPGSGKSFAAKLEMLSARLRSDDDYIYIIDPEGEYIKLAEALHGEVIELSTTSQSFINPLDMDIDYGGDGDPVSMKADYIISMIEIILGSGKTLTPQTKSIIDRCVKAIYRGYIEHIDRRRKNGETITIDREAMPTLANLYNELMRQPEEEAHTVAGIIELYAIGSLSTFSHRTNINPDAHIVVYDVSKLGTGMKNLGLHICLNEIWNRMIAHSREHKWTRFYIDEFSLLLQSDAAAAFLAQIWKRARKWMGVPTGILQNSEDLLRSANSRNIINNTGFIVMLNMARQDRVNLSDLLQIPETQLTYITNAERGHGLIYNEKTILPFKNEFPKDTEIYRIISTSKSSDDMAKSPLNSAI